MIRAGDGEPLVLLHGVLSSERAWTHVVPLLADHHDTAALTLLGHRGGNEPHSVPVGPDDMIDDLERQMDTLGFDTAHLAGNSLGGWAAVELARRGRARSLTLLSPAGCWEPDQRARSLELLTGIVAATRAAREHLDPLADDPEFRRSGLRLNAVHGDRVSPDEFLAIADDVLGCVLADQLAGEDRQLGPAPEVDVPITIAWAAHDHIFPPDDHIPEARKRLPQADVIVLPEVGHVPMFDDPKLVAHTILATTRLADASG
jgi:pimeloyl-ACP methyl ester carboxylesterase